MQYPVGLCSGDYEYLLLGRNF